MVAERRAARRRDLLSLLVEDESRNCTIGKSVGAPEMGDDERCGCIAEDVAYAMLFLASDEARFITAEMVNIDGGAAAKL